VVDNQQVVIMELLVEEDRVDQFQEEDLEEALLVVEANLQAVGMVLKMKEIKVDLDQEDLEEVLLVVDNQQVVNMELLEEEDRADQVQEEDLEEVLLVVEANL